MTSKITNIPAIILVAACIALNVAVGSLVYLIKAPIYLDSIGIGLSALLIPGSYVRAFLTASLVAILSFIIGGLIVNPFLPWFIATGIAGAAYWSFVVRRWRTRLMIGTASSPVYMAQLIGFGILWGIIAAIVSAPVVAYLFGGVTGSGTALIVAFFVKTGQNLLNAALLSGLSAEPVDKTLQAIIAVSIARATPETFRRLLEQ